MFTVHYQVFDALVKAQRYTRWIFLDVEAGADNTFHVVLRGEDKAKAGNPHASADNKPALHWNDESGGHRWFVVATCDNRENAELCAAQIIGFYSDADVPWADRFGALGDDARALIPHLMAVFGIALPPGKTKDDRGAASFADRADKAARRAQNDAKALLAKVSPILQQRKAQGADTSDIEAALAKLLSA